MRSSVLSIAIALFLSTGLFAQQTVTNEQHKRVLTHQEGNIYSVQFLDSENNIVQKGQYWKDGDLLKPHGTWVLFANNSDAVVTKSEFEKGEQVYVETYIDGELVKADKQLIAIKKIEKKIQELEKELADLKQN